LTKKLNQEANALASSAVTPEEKRLASARKIAVDTEAIKDDPDVVLQGEARVEAAAAANQVKIDEVYTMLFKVEAAGKIMFDEDKSAILFKGKDGEYTEELMKVNDGERVAADGNWILAAAKSLVGSANYKAVTQSLRMWLMHIEKKK